MKSMKPNGTNKVKSIEFFVLSPIDIMVPESSVDVIVGKYRVVVKFIFAVTFV